MVGTSPDMAITPRPSAVYLPRGSALCFPESGQADVATLSDVSSRSGSRLKLLN